MSPDEKFTYADLAYLRHVFQQYVLIDTESTVASLTPTDVENFQKVAREGRPFSYEFVETFQAIPERSSHKVGRFDFCPLRCSLSSVTDLFLSFYSSSKASCPSTSLPGISPPCSRATTPYSTLGSGPCPIRRPQTPSSKNTWTSTGRASER